MSILFLCNDCGKYFTVGSSSNAILTNMSLGLSLTDMAIGGRVLNQPFVKSDFLYNDGIIDSKICPYCYSWNTEQHSDNEKIKALFQKDKINDLLFTLERLVNLCKVLPFDYSFPDHYASKIISEECQSSILAVANSKKSELTANDFAEHASAFNRDLIIYSRNLRQISFVKNNNGLLTKKKGTIIFTVSMKDDPMFSKNGSVFMNRTEIETDREEWFSSVKKAYDVFHHYSAFIEI